MTGSPSPAVCIGNDVLHVGMEPEMEKIKERDGRWTNECVDQDTTLTIRDTYSPEAVTNLGS